MGIFKKNKVAKKKTSELEEGEYTLFYKQSGTNCYVLIPNYLNISETNAYNFVAKNQFEMRKQGIELFVGISSNNIEPVDVVWDLIEFN